MEIERKFLLKTIPENLEKYDVKNISQSYISTHPTIRIRNQDNKYILTIKSSGVLSRQEYEMELTKNEYENLHKKVETLDLIKKRYIIPLKMGLKAELDIYENELKGLYTVEVEFPNLDEALNFTPPSWFGKDVTTDNRYKNSSLIKNGIPHEI